MKIARIVLITSKKSKLNMIGVAKIWGLDDMAEYRVSFPWQMTEAIKLSERPFLSRRQYMIRNKFDVKCFSPPGKSILQTILVIDWIDYPTNSTISCENLVLRRPRPISEQNYCVIIFFNPSLYNMRTKPQTIIFFFDIQLLLFDIQ